MMFSKFLVFYFSYQNKMTYYRTIDKTGSAFDLCILNRLENKENIILNKSGCKVQVLNHLYLL